MRAVLFLGAAAAVLWLSHKQKGRVNRILLAVAAGMFSGGVLSLFRFHDETEAMQTVVLVVIVLAAIWLIIWRINRSALPKKSKKRRSRARKPGSRSQVS